MYRFSVCLISRGCHLVRLGREGQTYFVMSTPNVWQAAGVGEGPGLETSMVAVLLHEVSHVAQIGPYGPRLGALIERYHLPESFDDNAVCLAGVRPSFFFSAQQRADQLRCSDRKCHKISTLRSA